MPELPEVETIVSDLNKKLKNKIIIAFKILDKKVVQSSQDDFKKVAGKKVGSVERRAKMIIFNFGRDFLVMHLKMTGQLVLKTKNNVSAGGHPIIGIGKELPNKFTRLIFEFNDTSKLYFNDVRKFGWAKIINQDDFEKLDAEIGVEPLSKDFTLGYLEKIIANRKKLTIKQAIMDQKHIAGIGNIYADEALFMARIKPFRRSSSLKPAEIKKLWQAIPKILKFAVKHRGTSFSDYIDAQGETGNFIRYLKVYGRAGEKCRVCGNLILKKKLGGRGTNWCDECQK